MWMNKMQVNLRKMKKIDGDPGESSGNKCSRIAEKSNKFHMKKCKQKGVSRNLTKNEWMHALNYKRSLLIGSSKQTAEFMLNCCFTSGKFFCDNFLNTT